MRRIFNRLFVVTVQLFLVTPAMVWGQWVRQDTPPDISILLTVDFVSESTGAAGGWSFDSPIRARALYTTDGGSTWSMAQIPDSSRSLVRFQFVEGDTGYMVGAYNVPQPGGVARRKSINSPPSLEHADPIALGHRLMGIGLDSTEDYRGLFLKTTDAGKSWSTKGTLPDSVFYLFGSSFINVSLGYVTGTTTFNAGMACVLKTTDGGDSWIRMALPDSIDELRAISFRDSLLGVAVGYQGNPSSSTGIILRTTTGGASWQVQAFPDVGSFRDVSFIDSSVCLAVGGTGSGLPPNGAVYISAGAGLNWSPLPYSPPETELTGISFVKGTGTGIIIGRKLSGPAGPLIARTTDLGDTWTETILSSDSNGLLVGGKLLSPLIGYACGATDSGTGYMIHTANGGLLGFRDPGDPYPPGSGLSQNYPNPFNPSTQITYTLRSAATVSLKVFDVLGQVVATLVEERQASGEHRVEWIAEALPGGVYFYRLVAGEFTETKKMVLLR